MLRLHPRQLLRRPLPFPRHRQFPSSNPKFHPRQTIYTERSIPFSEFKPPPIRQRLRPLIPFFIYWSIITSLAVHLLRYRISSEEELNKQKAKITILSELIEKLQRGEVISQDEVQRELELVGLRERSRFINVNGDKVEGKLGRDDTVNVPWTEVLFGKKRIKEEENDVSLEEWVQVVNEASQPTTQIPTTPFSTPKIPERSGQAKRAPSASVYM